MTTTTAAQAAEEKDIVSNQQTATTPVDAFEHLNLNDVDTTFKAVEAGVYTLEVNKLDPVYRTIKKEDSPYAGQSVLVLRGSYTIVDDEKYSGRKIFKDYWTPFRFAQIGLKKQMQATGVVQQEGESLVEYAQQFAVLSPPARFQAPVSCAPDKRDPDGPPVNDIDLFHARPA